MTSFPGLLTRHNLQRFLTVLRREGANAALRRTAHALRRTQAGPAAPRQTDPPEAATPRFPLGSLWSDLSRVGGFQVGPAPAYLRRRRTVAMIGDLNLPQCRKYRVEQMAELLAAADIGYRFSHYEDVPRAIDILQDATHLMLYRMQRGDLTTTYLYEARRLRLPVIYDIDDPLFSVPAYETYSNAAAFEPGQLAQFVTEAPLYLDVMQQADFLTLSTPQLVDLASRMVPRPAFLRRNFADRETQNAGRHAHQGATHADKHFNVVFASGSWGHEADFLPIAEDLAAFLDRGFGRKLTILGHFRREKLPASIRARIAIQPFQGYPSYLQRLASAGCVIHPLTDCLFNRCKSGVRVIDAAAAGVPSVVTTIGDAQCLVNDGQTGLVLREGQSWTEVLEQLASEPEVAASMGAAARNLLESDWSAASKMPVVDAGFMRAIAA